MKLYRDSPQASTTMAHDSELINKLEEAIRQHHIDVAVETGTFEGTGSTRIVAQCFCRVGPPKVYVTFEVGLESWMTAYRNLSEFPFVDCRWGCSVEREKALAFVMQDEMLANHKNYPDIYIDDIDDPVAFYSRELRGVLGRRSIASELSSATTTALRKLRVLPSRDTSEKITESDVRKFFWSGEGLLPKYLKLHHHNRPLIILDSSGGCGWYEFQIMMEVMKDVSFLLLLDDVHHIKHYRSLVHVKSDPRFHLLGHSSHHGWALAIHS